jgi:hypothetical protein
MDCILSMEAGIKLWDLVRVLTRAINCSSPVSIIEQCTESPDQTGTRNCSNNKDGCDKSAYYFVCSASEKQCLTVKVAGIATVSLFKSMAQSVLNTTYVWEYGHYVVIMHCN